MAQLPPTVTMHFLVATGSTELDPGSEFEQLRTKVWHAFHGKAPLWRSRGSLHAKFFVCFAWARGPRLWTSGELHKARSLQVQHDEARCEVLRGALAKIGRRVRTTVCSVAPRAAAPERHSAAASCDVRIVVEMADPQARG